MQKIQKNLGYTIDQTILIVAIIAILITLIIATVGWDLINRAGGTKLAAQMRQIEDAAGQFYAQHQVWPHQATTSGNNWIAQARVLGNTGTGYTLNSNVDTTEMKNLISGFTDDGTNMLHNFGAGGEILMAVNTAPTAAAIGTNQYFIAQFANVPINEAEEADEAIDGEIDPISGRFFYRASGDCARNSSTASAPGGAVIAAGTATVTACYAANLIQ